MPRVKRHVSKKTTAFLLNKKADRKAERSANAENRRQKVAAKKAIHEAKLAEMSEEARAAYDTKALRKREGRQRWLDEYRTLDKQTKLERRVAKKNATQAKRVARAARKEAKLKLAQERSTKRDYRNNFKAMKSFWRRTKGESPAQTKQMKKALYGQFKDAHWKEAHWDKYENAKTKRRDAYRAKKATTNLLARRKEPATISYGMV